jgi:large-conductance mechanosensitive channel
VADLRERGTTFLTKSSSLIVSGTAIGLAIGATIGLAFGTLVSPVVGDLVRSLGPATGVVDLFQFILRNPNALVPVSSLTAMKEAGITTPDLGVIIIAVLTFTITALHIPGREGDLSE